MDRRRFLEMSAGGLGGAYLPALAFAPTQDELIDRAMALEQDAMIAAYGELGIALEAGTPPDRRRLEGALGLYEQAILAYQEALRRRPDDVLVLELLGDLDLETATLETVLGRDVRKRAHDALVHAEKWARLRPEDPVTKEALGHHRSRASRLLELASAPVARPFQPRDIVRINRRSNGLA